MSNKQKCVIFKMEVDMLEELYKIFKECFPTTKNFGLSKKVSLIFK